MLIGIVLVIILLLIIILGVFAYRNYMKPSSKYKFYPMKDSAGSDIKALDFDTYHGKIDKIAKECNNTEGCVAFNSGGWLKSSLRPKSEWAPAGSGWMTEEDNDGLYISKDY